MAKEIEQFQNFAITVTLKPEYQTGSVNTQLVWAYGEIQRIIKRYIHFLDETKEYYTFYPEFTENLGLHFHGILLMAKTASIIRRKHMFTNNIGYSLIKPCKDFHIWLKYMSKNEQITKQVYPTVNLPLNNETILKISDERYIFEIEEPALNNVNNE